MTTYHPDHIRNVAIAGHVGSGKTMLCEALALSMGITNRLGHIEDGTTISDHAPDEIARKHSVNASVINGVWRENKINIIDTPGFIDFHGDVKSTMRVADTVLVTVNASMGVEVGTDLVWDYTKEFYKPTAFIITKLDVDRADYDTTVEQLKEHFGHGVVPVQFPADEGLGHHILIDVLLMKLVEFSPDKPGSMVISEIPDLYRKRAEEYHQELVESVAETDEGLMNKFFEVGELSEDELLEGIKHALVARTLFPVFCTSPLHLIGTERLLNMTVNLFPTPIERGPEHAIDVPSGQDHLVEPNPDGETVGYIFKTVSEPHIGEISYVRIYSGHIESGHELVDAQTGQPEKLGQIFTLIGHEKIPAQKLVAGDIGAVVKLKDAHTNDTLADKGVKYIIKPIEFPRPVVEAAIKPVAQGDEEKISVGLHHLHEEDPSFSIKHEKEFNQTVLCGLGEIHIETIVRRLKEKFNVDVEIAAVKIPYRETIQVSADSQGKFKRQSGGRGQYGDVWMRIDPLPRGTGFEFASEVVGGVVPTRYIPAVQKGVEETITSGVLAGYPVVDIKAVVYDGSYHPVDSSEYAFKIAASMGFKAAFEKAKPILLEPIYKLDVYTPEQFTGEIMGELSSRRGKIQGMEVDTRMQILHSLVPQAELHTFHSALNRLTQGRARYSYEFSHYEEAPYDAANKVIEEARAQKVEH
ncbi:MAG: elongation factor G [Chlorobiales bacterium]|nr:elongation factor G [Chlorobiales bacterium]